MMGKISSFFIYILALLQTGLSKKIPAKFSDSCSVRADGLCIGCLGQWAERGREDSNMQEFFLLDPVEKRNTTSSILISSLLTFAMLEAICLMIPSGKWEMTLPCNVLQLCSPFDCDSMWILLFSSALLLKFIIVIPNHALPSCAFISYLSASQKWQLAHCTALSL